MKVGVSPTAFSSKTTVTNLVSDTPVRVVEPQDTVFADIPIVKDSLSIYKMEILKFLRFLFPLEENDPGDGKPHSYGFLPLPGLLFHRKKA